MSLSVGVETTSDERAPLVTNYGSAPSKLSKNNNKRLSYCGICLCVSLLIIGISFVLGIMYANFNDTVLSFNNRSTHAKSHLINGHASSNYNCSTYPYTEEVTETTDDGEEDSYTVYFWCYLSTDECEYCYDESEESGPCDDDYKCQSECSNTNDLASAENGLTVSLFCYSGEKDNTCFSWDTIVTKLVDQPNNNNDNNELITEDIMIKDINLGDYLLSGINGEFSKVIDKTHYTPYEGSLQQTLMRELCFELEDGDDMVNNCIKLTPSHLIYVNGIDLDSIKAAEDVIIDDYLYHSGLNKMVKIISIKDNLLEYYRGFVTENGNIIVNNGFYSSTLATANRFNNPKYMHLSQIYVLNFFYKLFTFNGIYDGIWNNYYFNQIIKLPTKSAILQWIGMKGIYVETDEYRYPLEYTICAQSVGFILVYLMYKAFNNVLKFSSSKVKQC